MTNAKVPRRKFLKYTVAGVVVAAAAGAGAYYYLYNSPGGSGKPNSATIAWNFQINSLGPYTPSRNPVTESPLDAIYDKFMYQDRSLKSQPGILTSWQWGSDNKTITANVRSGVKFHNGDDLTADDVAFSMTTLGGKDSAWSGVWNIITGIDINSSTSLTLHLSHFDPAFPDFFAFTSAFVIPKNYYTQVGASAFAASPVGSGPYKFVSYQGGVLKLQANPNYWQGAPAIQNIVFKEVTDAAARATEMQSGTSDYTTDIDVAVYSQLSGISSLVSQKLYTTNVASFFVAPYFEPFKDLGVRQAINYALDRNSLVNNILLGFGRPVSMPEAPGYWSYDSNFNIPFDPNKAQSLLQAAGYGSSNLLNLSVMTTNGATTKDYEITQACVQMWKNVGINVMVDTITVGQFFSDAFQNGTADALAYYVWSNTTGDPELDIGYTMSPSSPFSEWNGMKTAGKTDYTGLMNQAQQILNPVFSDTNQNARIQAGTQASEWAVNNGLIIPLFQTASPVIMKKNLQYTPWPQGWTYAYDMSWQ